MSESVTTEVTRVLGAKEIADAQDFVDVDIPVPEWGGEGAVLRVRSLSAERFLEYLNMVEEKKSRGETIARMIVLSAIDAAGNRLFALDDIPMLQRKNLKMLKRISSALMELNGMDEKKEKEAAKNV